MHRNSAMQPCHTGAKILKGLAINIEQKWLPIEYIQAPYSHFPISFPKLIHILVLILVHFHL